MAQLHARRLSAAALSERPGKQPRRSWHTDIPESPARDGPCPSPGPMQPLSAARVDRAVDVSAVKQNLLPVPAALSPEWKRATDSSTSPESRARNSSRDRACRPSLLLPGTVLHRCLEDFTTSGQYDLEGIMRELPEIDRAEGTEKEAFIAGAEAVLRSVTGNRDRLVFERRPGAYQSCRSSTNGGTTWSAASLTVSW